MTKRKRRSSRRKWYKRDKLKKELKYCLIIAMICLVMSIGLAFLTGKVPDFLDKAIDRQMDRVVGEKKKEIEKELLERSKDEDVSDLVKEYLDRAKK